jgi:hypothetical protein
MGKYVDMEPLKFLNRKHRGKGSERALPVGSFALQPFGGRFVWIDLARVTVLQLPASQDDESENTDDDDQKDRERNHRRKSHSGHWAILISYPNGHTGAMFRQRRWS